MWRTSQAASPVVLRLDACAPGWFSARGASGASPVEDAQFADLRQRPAVGQRRAQLEADERSWLHADPVLICNGLAPGEPATQIRFAPAIDIRRCGLPAEPNLGIRVSLDEPSVPVPRQLAPGREAASDEGGAARD